MKVKFSINLAISKAFGFDRRLKIYIIIEIMTKWRNTSQKISYGNTA